MKEINVNFRKVVSKLNNEEYAISDFQAKQFASSIYLDIAEYFKNNNNIEGVKKWENLKKRTCMSK